VIFSLLFRHDSRNNFLSDQLRDMHLIEFKFLPITDVQIGEKSMSTRTPPGRSQIDEGAEKKGPTYDIVGAEADVCDHRAECRITRRG
jgi:hypothetical protein